MKRTISGPLAILLATAITITGCSEDETTSAEQPVPEASFAAKAKRQLDWLLAVEATKTIGELVATQADDYRRISGARARDFQSRRSDVEKALQRAASRDRKPGELQLAIADDTHALTVLIGLRAWAFIGDDQPGRYLRAHVYEFDDDGRAKAMTRWLDAMTVFKQAGLKTSLERPMTELAWPETLEVAADGGEAETSRIARVGEFIDSIANQDVDNAQSLVADEFVDRDIASVGPRIYDDRKRFGEALAKKFEKIEVDDLKVLDLWGAGEWVVAEISHSYRLRERSTSGRARQALSYELWLFRVKDDAIRARWRFRDSLVEGLELRTIDGRELALQQRALRKARAP